jgi:ABC-type Fe3+ transport system substrate-binding protein
MTDVLVYAVASRETTARKLLGAACQASGVAARLELYSSAGSLYQRLGPRRAAPFPDVVMWFGPYAARAAALDGLLQPYQPPTSADGVVHDPDWRWTTLDYSSIGVVGPPGIASLQDLAAVNGLALTDPERSEGGMATLLASLDRARQAESDVERGWAWWQQRMRGGVQLSEDDAGALASVGENGITHAVTLAEAGAPLLGLAPLPHAIGLAAASRNVDAARRLLDWLTGPDAGALVRLSPWQTATATGPLTTLLSAAPPLDVEWGREQYTAARNRWAQSGFGPIVTS